MCEAKTEITLTFYRDFLSLMVYCLYLVLNHATCYFQQNRSADRSVPVNQVDNNFNDLHFETWEIFFKSKRLNTKTL